eukprot:Skav216876  [mRNA]  locus=scaffold1042:407105:412632:+ [translate_table: standard]
MAALDIYDGGLDKLLAAYYQLHPAQNGFAIVQIGNPQRAALPQRYLTRDDLTLELPRWSGLLEQVAQELQQLQQLQQLQLDPDECELLLDLVGLGLGPKQLPYRGPGPPPLDWDGLSVAVWNVPRKTTEQQIRVLWLEEWWCASWLVHFCDAKSAVETLVSTRRLEGQRLQEADWQPVLHQAVRESFEYWLGPDNLPKDAFLRRHDRFVPLRVFVMFRRLQVLKGSELLEVQGEGREAMVRRKEDCSRRPDESEDQVEAVQKLLPEYNARYGGPVAAGSPAAEDAEAVMWGSTAGLNLC